MKKIIFYLAAFIIVFSTLSFGSPVTDYSFVREFGETGIDSNKFYKMDGIAVDRFGHVFITDPYGFVGGTSAMTNFSLGVKRWSTDGVYEHMVYSDGLAAVSVYIEQQDIAAAIKPGVSQLGTNNAYTSRQGDLQITVIGEVPAITVKSIASEIALSVASD